MQVVPLVYTSATLIVLLDNLAGCMGGRMNGWMDETKSRGKPWIRSAEN